LGESSLGHPGAADGQLRPAVWQTTSWPPPPFCNFGIFFTFFWCVMRMGLAFWENGCTAFPFFKACPYTSKGEIFHSSWSLEISFDFVFFRPHDSLVGYLIMCWLPSKIYGYKLSTNNMVSTIHVHYNIMLNP
jgi:hypothetical protein